MNVYFSFIELNRPLFASPRILVLIICLLVWENVFHVINVCHIEKLS